MAVQIRIIPDALRDAAEKHHMIANRMDEMQSRLKQAISSMDEAWEGSISRKLQENLQEIGKATGNMMEFHVNNFQKLNGIVQAFESIDNDEPVITASRIDSFRLLGIPAPDLQFSWKEDRLRINPEETRGVAEQCRVIADDYAEIEEIIRDSANELEANWEGNAYNKYRAETDEVLKNMEDVKDILLEVSDKIHKAVSRYEEIDNMF